MGDLTPEKLARIIARQGLKPLFARPCAPEEIAACDGLTEAIATAIREAEARGMERAADLVEKYPGTPARWSWMIQAEIAAAIRAAKERQT